MDRDAVSTISSQSSVEFHTDLPLTDEPLPTFRFFEVGVDFELDAKAAARFGILTQYRNSAIQAEVRSDENEQMVSKSRNRKLTGSWSSRSLMADPTG